MATYYVNAVTGNDGNNGVTPTSAWASVSKAITVATNAGDIVHIAAGTYSANLVFGMNGASGNPITFTGDGNAPIFFSSGDVHKITGSWITLSGITFHCANSSASSPTYVPGGTFCYQLWFDQASSNCVVTNCIFENVASPSLHWPASDSADYPVIRCDGTNNLLTKSIGRNLQDCDFIGWAFGTQSTNFQVTNCEIYNITNPNYNSGPHSDFAQGGNNTTSGFIIDSCFVHDLLDNTHIGVLTGDVTVRNCIFNKTPNGCFFSDGGGHPSNFYNNTLLDAGSDPGIGNIAFFCGFGCNIRNNVIVYSSGATNVSISGSGGTISNNFQGTLAAALFVNGSGTLKFATDFQIQTGSPAHGTGVVLTPNFPDYNGVARPSSGVWDEGAFQFAVTSGSLFTPVQSGINGNTVLNSVTVAFPSAVTTGNAIVVEAGCTSATATVSSVTDTLGNTYSLAKANAGNGRTTWIYYCPNSIGTGADSVTFTLNASGGFLEAVLHEVHFVGGTFTLQQSNGATGTGATTGLTGQITSLVLQEIVYGYINFSLAGTGITSGPAWIGGNTAVNNISAYNLAVSLGTYQLTATQSSAGTFNGIIVSFSVVAASGSSLPTNVQAQVDGNGVGNSLTKAFAANVTAGNTLFCAIGVNNPAATISSISDSRGNTWVLAKTQSGNFAGWIYYVKASGSSGADTVSVAVSSSGGFIELVLWEFNFSGGAMSTLDVGSGSSGTGTAVTSGVTATRNFPNEVLIGYNILAGALSAIAPGWTGGSGTNGGTAVQNVGEYKIVTATGTDAATSTQGSSTTYLGLVATFYGAQAAPNALMGTATLKAACTGVLKATKPLAGAATLKANHRGNLVLTNALKGTAVLKAAHAGVLKVPTLFAGTAVLKAAHAGRVNIAIVPPISPPLYPTPGWNLLYSVYGSYTIILTIANVDYSWLFLTVVAGPFPTYQAALTYQLAAGLL